MIQRQIARGLEDERLKMSDGTFTQRTGHAKVGFLQQVFGGAGVTDHALQRAQQDRSSREENVIEVRLTHRDTRPEIQRMIMLIICFIGKVESCKGNVKAGTARLSTVGASLVWAASG